ncbi:hypothetical protein MHU86_16268 [Fragilaria crotonensis]|nr:hypothetical protein MHU86_16268 [Fragilaria crotonensis]
MTGSLHHVWNDHICHQPLTLKLGQSEFQSAKNARSKVPLRQGSEPFHQLHLDLLKPIPFGLTTSTNYSAYLFIVTTPGKLTGWIGLPTESTLSILTALQSWLTQSELLGAPNLSALSALMLEQHLLLPNSSQLAPILESKLKLQPLNIKK